MTCAIIIPTKDRPEGLRAAVSSAVAALPPNGRVVVVDDGSSVPATSSLAKFDEAPVEVIKNPGPRGAAAARNFGVGHVNSETIFFLDDDDVMLPGYPASIAAALEGPGACARFGFSAIQRGDRVSGKHLDEGIIPADTPLSERLAGLGMGFWIRRDTFQDLGGIEESLTVNEDTEFYLRLAANGLVGWYSQTPGVSIRPPASSGQGDLGSVTDRSSAAERAAAFEKILTRHYSFLQRHPAQRRAFARRVVKYRVRAGETSAARAFICDQPNGRTALRLGALGWRALGLLAVRKSHEAS